MNLHFLLICFKMFELKMTPSYITEFQVVVIVICLVHWAAMRKQKNVDVESHSKAHNVNNVTYLNTHVKVKAKVKVKLLSILYFQMVNSAWT